jgi:hypothetical protein
MEFKKREGHLHAKGTATIVAWSTLMSLHERAFPWELEGIEGEIIPFNPHRK